MADDPSPSAQERSAADPVLFAPSGFGPERSSPLPWLAAGAVVLLIAAFAFLMTRHHSAAAGTIQANTVQDPAPYASSLAMTDLQMSESAALSGVKVTYLDGHIRNNGNRTVTGASAQVRFSNDEQLPPQLERVSVSLVRTHEPYVDIQPISAAPLAPGEQREFRLIFENINSNWNGQMPIIRLIEVSTR